jgi:Skp family chaperone for outer membrane proteins
VRFPLVCATVVAGPLSLFFLAAPVAAQNGLPPGGARPQAAPAQAGTSVAVIDIAFIFKNHVRFNGQMNDMKRDIEAFDAQMREESQKLAKKQEVMQGFTPTSAEFKRADEELAHLKSDFQIRVQAKKREFLELEAKVYYGIYREVEESVAIFAQRNGIGLVLRYTGDEMKADDRASVLQGVNKPVVYQDRLDITQHILNQLNAGATMPPQNRGSVPPPNGTVGGPIPPGTQTGQRPTGPIVPGAPNRTR